MNGKTLLHLVAAVSFSGKASRVHSTGSWQWGNNRVRTSQNLRIHPQTDPVEEQFTAFGERCVDPYVGITQEDFDVMLSNFRSWHLSVALSKFEKLVIYNYEWGQLCDMIWGRLLDDSARGTVIADFRL